jgi:hypothetical protein
MRYKPFVEVVSGFYVYLSKSDRFVSDKTLAACHLFITLGKGRR